jgi:nucleoid-associated protein YgaU
MPPEFTPQEFPEPKDVGQIGHSSVPNAHVEAQLNQPADVSQAHQFFQPRVDSALPTISFGDGGASVSSIPHGILPGGEHAMAVPAGAEHAMATLPTGGEHGALAMLTPQPGAEQAVNPLIQMIMKMPGLTGFMTDFFDFLKSLFEGNLMESLTSALMDPAGLMIHLFQEAGESMAVPIDVMKSASPMLSFQNGMFGPGAFNGMNMHHDLLGVGANDAANVGAPISSPDMGNAIFEKTSNYSISEYHQNSLLDWHRPHDQIAGGAEAGVYRPSMGAYQAPAVGPGAQTPVNATTGGASAPAPNVHQAAATHHAPAHHAAPQHHYRAHEVPIHRVSHDQIAQAPQATDATGGQYTVQSGDSLWDIARHQLGDGSRWGEIYRVNADVIGQNPDIIHPGLQLRMPDGTNTVANAAGEGSKYIVQPGDNLWSISQQHMGGGQNWGELYRMNEGVIGANPRMLMPGEQLSLGGGAPSVAHVAPAQMSNAVAYQPTQMANQVAYQQPALQAQAPEMAPVDNSQMYSAQDGSLFYRKPQ